MRVCLAQLHPCTSTSLPGAPAGADLVAFPELYLGGYRGDRAWTTDEVAPLADGAGSALVGFQERDGAHTYNSAAYVERGRVLRVQRKLALVEYPPFDEHERFEPGDELHVFDTEQGARVAILICNDAWQPDLAVRAARDGAEVLLMPSASSTAVPEAEEYWRDLTRFYARMLECYVVFVNHVGVQDGWEFWGGSHVVDPLGRVVAEAPRDEEALVACELDLDLVARRRRELPLLRR